MSVQENLLENIKYTNYQTKTPNFKRVKWINWLAFEVLGVKIGVRSNNSSIIEKVKNGLPDLLPIDIKTISFEDAEHFFSVYQPRKNSKNYWIKKDDSDEIAEPQSDQTLDSLNSKIRLTVAEFAQNFIFLHAGVVCYKGKAIIIPAKSFSGKSTLVAELAKRGFEYYSDEYAVIDEQGFVHPFAKKISMRGIIDEYQQVDIAVEDMGGVKGEQPIKVGLILISKYQKNARFKPKQITTGEGIIESIANSVSIRQNPKLVLDVLSQITSTATIIKMKRDEAAKFADQFIPYLEKIGY